jgi:hypothetical protein
LAAVKNEEIPMNRIVLPMLALVLSLAVVVTGCSPGVNPQDAKAVAEINRLGGSVFVDKARPDKPVISVTLGPDASGSTNVTDTSLEQIRGFTQLRKLDVTSTQVTDAGLENLAGLHQLQELNLMGTKVTDEGLKYIKELGQLQDLSLADTKVTDTGLEDLRNLTQLQRLDLSGTLVTDVGLQHLVGLKQLRYLDLVATQVTEAGLKNIQQALPTCKIEWTPPTKDKRQSPAAPDQLR